MSKRTGWRRFARKPSASKCRWMLPATRWTRRWKVSASTRRCKEAAPGRNGRRQREKTRVQNFGHLQIAAPAVAIEDGRADVQRYRHRDPELPVGKQAGDAERAGGTQLRSQAPESQNV